jgi:hypothetical protein
VCISSISCTLKTAPELACGRLFCVPSVPQRDAEKVRVGTSHVWTSVRTSGHKGNLKEAHRYMDQGCRERERERVRLITLIWIALKLSGWREIDYSHLDAMTNLRSTHKRLITYIWP